jgi:hypothetical protein
MEIEEQLDDHYRHYFHPSEIHTYQFADEIYLKLYQNQDWLLDYLNNNNEYIKQETDSSQREIYQHLNSYVLSMALYFVVIKAAGRKISQLKNPDDHEHYYKRIAKLLFHKKNFTFSQDVLELLKSLIEEELSTEFHRITPHIMVYCVIFIASNNNEEENLNLLKCLEKAFGPTHEDIYLMYRVAYHRTHHKMDIEDFLGRYVSLHLFDMAIPYKGVQFLFNKIPSILINRLSLEMPIAERLDLFMFLRYPFSETSAEQIGNFLHSTEPSVVKSHIQITRSFYNLIKQGENTDFVNLCKMMTFMYSCRNSCEEIINAFSSEEKELLKNECNKYLATFRSLDNKTQNQTDYDYHIFCSYMAACFLRDTVSFWAAIKPLLLAVRMSKKILVPQNLKVVESYRFRENNLASVILLLFDMQDEFTIEKELKRLRRDMADGLMELLKPLSDKKYKPDRVKNYSEVAQKRDGFDPHSTEPDPLYRQSYIEAFSELCIKCDDSGHTFFAELNRLASNDLSPKVQSVAKDAIRKLNNTIQPENEYNQKAYIKTALWHIWKAHVFEHEAPYDEDAALETKAGFLM